ncbi:hypothetical protein BC628DRAFT_1370962 [Trametes gibbosa]|nr:hypothetical protein BC628DRAFT_1370962 [Trametes gibbosa]
MNADGDIVPPSVHIHNYLHLAGIAVLYYDFLLTFGEEYFRIWKNPRSISSILFFLNRYLPVLGDIAVNTGNFYIFPDEQVCRRYAFFRQLLLIINQVVVCFILFLRTYALFGRDKRIGALVFGVGMTLLAVSCWSIVGQHQDVELRGGCHLLAERLTAVRLAVSWEALFAFDLMVFTLTVCKTFRERHRHRITSGRHDIISLILRDGSMYFAVMASVNFANTLTFYLLEPLLRGCLSTFASSVSVTMMSRLMLNLQGSASGHNALASSSPYPSTSDNSTSMLFTSRISMRGAATHTHVHTSIAAPYCDFDGPGSPGGPGPDSAPPAGAYVRDPDGHHHHSTDGYIGELYELHDLSLRGDGADRALRMHDSEDGLVRRV